MPRDHARSQQSLKVRAHHLLDPIDLRKSCESCSVWLLSPFPICPDGFDRNVEPNLVAVLEAVGDRFFRRVNPNGNIVNGNHIDASPEGRLGVPEDPKRDAIDFWSMRVARQRDIHGVWDLSR
jgi:hypothetical protein